MRTAKTLIRLGAHSFCHVAAQFVFFFCFTGKKMKSDYRKVVREKLTDLTS